LDADRGKRTSGGFFLPTQMLLIGGLALLLTVGFGAYFKGKEHGLEIHYAYKAEVEAANAVIAEKNAERVRSAEANTAHVAELYAAHSDAVRSALVSRLHKAQRDCAGVSAAAGPARESDGTAPDARPDTTADATYEAVCERLEKDCAATTLQTIWLQDWVVRVCK
jgi:hypothetical protein